MLSASQLGAGTPLSPLTQTTLEKHLPGLPKRRFLQQNQAQKCDVGCITGTFRFFLPTCIFRDVHSFLSSFLDNCECFLYIEYIFSQHFFIF